MMSSYFNIEKDMKSSDFVFLLFKNNKSDVRK